MPTEDKLWLPPSFTNGKAPVTLAPKKRGIKWGFANRTTFDWIMLVSQVLAAFITPFVVTMLWLYATQQITQQQTQLSGRQHQVDLQIAADNRQKDIQIADDQQKEAILKTFLNDMTDLMLNHGLRQSKFGDDVRVVAHAKTLIALLKLDPNRKGALIQFLYGARLIGGMQTLCYCQPTSYPGDVSLEGADLKGIKLELADLSGADLSGADLSEADLLQVKLHDADLSRAFLLATDLSGANLSGANLRDATLYDDTVCFEIYCDPNSGTPDAKLFSANLSYADLTGTAITDQQLAQASSLQGATMPNGSTHP